MITTVLFNAFYIAVLAAISYTDIKTHKIPNRLLLALLLTGSLQHLIQWDFPRAFAGAILSGLMFLWVYKAKGSKMGLGDVKLGGVLGFVFGYPSVVLFLLWTGVLSLVGALWKKSVLPFAPFMAVGAVLAFIFTF